MDTGYNQSSPSHSDQQNQHFLDTPAGIVVVLAIVMFLNHISLLDPLLEKFGIKAMGSSGFSLLEVLGIPLALLAIWVVWLVKRGRAAELGLARPASWPKTILLGIALALAVKLLVIPVGKLIELGGLAGPDHSRHEAVQTSLSQLIMMLTVSWTTAGFGEEVIWRGFFMGQVAKLFNNTKAAWVLSIVLMVVLFGLLHSYQGLAGIILTGYVGLIFGIAYLLFNRNLWIVFIAHGTTNSISFLMLYLGIGLG